MFRRSVFPRLDRTLSCADLIAMKGTHGYGGSWETDNLYFYSNAETFRSLALLILAVVFRATPRVTVNLTHPESVIRRLVVRSQWASLSKSPHGFCCRPEFFHYWTGAALRHPWTLERPDVHLLPQFELTNIKDAVYSEAERKARDTVIGFGTDAGAVRLAELLLNFSRPQCKIDEIELEGEAGFRGVAPMSAEAHFRLPDSFGWESFWKIPKGKRRERAKR